MKKFLTRQGTSRFVANKSFWLFCSIIAVGILMTACADSGPVEDFDITGLWKEINDKGTLNFKEDGRYEIRFPLEKSPDGSITYLEGSYKRIDNSHVQLSMVFGPIGDIRIVEPVGKISSKNILTLKIEGKKYKYTKS